MEEGGWVSGRLDDALTRCRRVLTKLPSRITLVEPDKQFNRYIWQGDGPGCCKSEGEACRGLESEGGVSWNDPEAGKGKRSV